MADIKELYSYFSHNFRTNVSTIIATIEAVRLDLIDIHSDEMNSVYESAYMLDLFDTSLSICLEFVTDGKVDADRSELDPTFYVQHLIKEFDVYIKESEMALNLNLTAFTTTSNEFTVKNLIQLITCEMLRLSPSGMSVNGEDQCIRFIPMSTFDDIPIIFETFKAILNACDVGLQYSNEEVRLEFL